MLRSPSLNQCTLILVERENRSSAPERIPDLFDELESLPDGQPFQIDCWIHHLKKSVRCHVLGQLSFAL